VPQSQHRKNLTPTLIKGLRSAPQGARYQVMDAQVPGFGVRVTETGAKTFILRMRFPGGGSASRREIGDCAEMKLTDARDKARKWRSLVGQGLDPAMEEERERQESLRKVATTFGAVAHDFIRDKVAGERKAKEIKRDIERDLLPKWEKWPITSITDMHVIGIIKAKMRDGKVGARNLLALVKRFFRWAIAQRTYGLAHSPCEGLQASMVIGETKGARDRILSDDEIFALWRATKRMSTVGAVYQGLMLTALRLNEMADASRPEFNWRDRVWVIPAERMKGKNAGKKQARAHAVPLTDELLAVLDSLPKLNGGPYLFSTTNGEKPVWMNTSVKERLDRRMLRTLRAMARVRGDDDPHAVELQHFVNHDIRRTVRSRLSRLKVTEEAREAVLAHARPGIKGVYDVHDYLDEKREALELWAARLMSITATVTYPKKSDAKPLDISYKVGVSGAQC
jgi:Arm DNA-binding domain/Phage integrase family